jgi:flagellar hook assembly protein FlgD
VVVRDWDAYTEMVLALTNIDLTNLASEYSVSAVYDSTLTGDQEQPVALSLGQNYPNPFRPGEQGETVLPFELRQSSQNNRLSIFNPAGELIQRFSLGPLRAAAHIQSWDGRNLAGKLVSSGVYYYLLESDGREVAQTMAVIRD